MKRESGLAVLASIILPALFSLTSFAAGPAAASRLTKPDFGRVKAVSPFEIDLTWRDRSSNEDGFQIERSTDRTNFRQIAQVLPGTTIYRDKNLFPGTRYFYRIRSFNASGASRYSTTSARTQTPVVPLSVAEWGNFVAGIPATDVVSVSAGDYHSLALKKDGTVIAWGDNSYGEATPPANLNNVIAISAGNSFSVALKNDGTVVEWGFNVGGLPGGFRLPPPTLPPPILLHPIGPPLPQPPIPLPIPPRQPVPPLRPILPIQPIPPVQLVPQQQTLSLPAARLATPVRLSPPSDLAGVVAISAGTSHILALKGDGTVVAWGANFNGAITPPADLSGVVEIAAGNDHSLALKSDGTVVGWGSGFPGSATPPTNLTSVIAIAAGTDLSLALKSDGTVVAWGVQSELTTTATSNLTDVAAIALGSNEGVALRKDGSLFSWSLGFPPPDAPDLGNSVMAIRAKGNHHLALSTAPIVPSNLFITILSENQLRLSWQDNSSDEKSFVIERSGFSPDDNLIPWAQIGTVGANTTNFIDTTVEIGAIYTYRLRAIGKFGTSPYSALINAKVSPLAAPDFLSTTLGTTNEVILSWYDAFSGVDSFKIERAPDDHGQPGAWAEIASDIVTNFLQNTFTDATAQPNNKYWYRVRAANILGFSDYSDPISINVAPPQPPRFFGGSPFADSITVSWFEPVLNTRGVKLERAPDVNGAPGAWTQIATIDATNTAQYVDQGLSLDTTYWYRARAYNWVGDSDYAGPVRVTVVPPAPPTQVSVNIGSTNGIDISWYPVINDEDGFRLERAPDVGGVPGAWTEIASFNDVHVYFQSFHDINVVANNTYWYRVRSFNLFGFSDYGTPVSVSLVPPPAPTLTAATPSGASVNLQWQDNTPNLLYFKIERAPDAGGAPGAWNQVGIISGGISSYNDSNLTPGAVYWYRVRAVSWIGDSPYSGLAAVTIDPPSTPRIAAIALNSAHGVDLTFSDTVGDEDGFLVERAVPTDLGFVDWTQIAKLDMPNFATVYFTDTNVAPNTTNLYRVRAFNSVGTSDYSSVSTIAVVRPAQPFLIGGASSTSASLNWNDPNFTAEATLGYRLQRAPDAGGHPGTWTQIAAIDGGYLDYNYLDTGRTPGATYWYRVQAFNWVGDSDFSDPFPIAIMPPNPPLIQLAAVSVTNHQADIYWYDGGADEDGIAVERAPDENGAPGAWSPIATVYATNSLYGTFSDTNAVAYTTNWYRIRALNAAGLSDYSAPVVLQIVPSSTPNLEPAPFDNKITLTWYDPASYYDGIAGYKLERAPDVSGAPGSWTQLTNTPDSLYIDKNLAADTIYWYRIRSYNWVGDSAYSTPLSTALMPPGQPSNLVGAPGAATNTVLLQWLDLDRDENGFKIERSGDAGGYPDDHWQEIGSVNAVHADQASFVDTNVTANTTNWYRVRAFSGAGFSDYDGDLEVRVVPPDAPVNMYAISYNGIPEISWNENFGIGGGGFVIQRTPDAGVPGFWTDIATNTQSVMFYDDTGLLTSGVYSYRVRAFNWIGTSDYGQTVSASVIPPVTPAKPNAPSGSPSATNQVNLSWTDFYLDQDGFIIQRASDVDGGPGTWAQIGIITNLSYFATFIDTNVTPNTTNWYRVQAFSSAGVSEFSDSNSVAIIPPHGTPTLFGSVITAHHIYLDFYTTDEFVQGYKIERAPDVGGAPGAWSLIGDVPGSFLGAEFNDLAVAMNQSYWYRVKAYTWIGESPYSNELLLNDAPPAAPFSLAVTNDQPYQFTLTWAITNQYGVDSVKIERAPDNSGVPGAWTQIAEPNTLSGIIPTNYTDIGIPTGQTFWYRVRAVNDIGDSPYSNEASATSGAIVPALSALPAQPQILSLTPTNGGMLIEWSSTAGNTDVVQASGSFAGGYTNISPALVIDGSGNTITNYFDAGALTHSAARFYRIQSSR